MSQIPRCSCCDDCGGPAGELTSHMRCSACETGRERVAAAAMAVVVNERDQLRAQLEAVTRERDDARADRDEWLDRSRLQAAQLAAYEAALADTPENVTAVARAAVDVGWRKDKMVANWDRLSRGDRTAAESVASDVLAALRARLSPPVAPGVVASSGTIVVRCKRCFAAWRYDGRGYCLMAGQRATCLGCDLSPVAPGVATPSACPDCGSTSGLCMQPPRDRGASTPPGAAGPATKETP